MSAPVPALPVAEPIAAPAPAPIKPPESARSPGFVPHAESTVAATAAARTSFNLVIAIIHEGPRWHSVNARARQWFATPLKEPPLFRAQRIRAKRCACQTP